MYVTGTKYDLENRLHQLATGMADVNAYQSEALTYNYVEHRKYKVNREFQKRAYIVTENGQYLDDSFI